MNAVTPSSSSAGGLDAVIETARRADGILGSMAEAVHLLDNEGRIVYQNAASARLFGWSDAELLGRSGHDLLHHHRADGTPYPVGDCPTAIVLRTGEGRRIEGEVMFRRDGSVVPVNYSCQPIRDPEGAVIGVVCSLGDRSDLERASQQSRRLTEQLLATYESLAERFVALDDKWRIVYVNRNALYRVGLASDEVIGRRLWEVVPELVEDEVADALWPVMETGEPVQLEVYLRTFEAWFEVRAVRTAFGISVYSRDISDERELRRSLQMQATLLQRLPDAVILRDLEHRIMYWNPAAEQIYGWTAGEATGRSIRDLLYDSPMMFDRITAQVLDKGQWSGQVQHRHRSGATLLVEARWTALRDSDGNPTGVLAINTDVTARRAMEQHLLREQRAESMGTLAAGLAHNLNNQLAPIPVYAEMLRDQVRDPSGRELLDSITAGAAQASSLLAEMLIFTRGSNAAYENVCVGAVLRDVAKLVAETFPRSIHVDFEEITEQLVVHGNAAELHQVLLNLCINARDAMPDGGVLRIVGERVELDADEISDEPEAEAGPYLCLRVIDTGHGMPPEVAEHVFDPFFTTKGLAAGSGLGLPTSLVVVRAHRGFFRLRSTPEVGTEFAVYLPALSGPCPPVPQEALPPRRGRGETVLVIDDERAVAGMVGRALSANGYEPVVVSSARDALTALDASDRPIEVVLTDLMMRDMDGLALAREMTHRYPGIPVIMMTGVGAADHQAQMTAAGVVRLIPKPFTTATLLDAVADALDARAR